jgi:hypothetical protein
MLSNGRVIFYIMPVEGAGTKVGLCLGYKLALIWSWLLGTDMLCVTFKKINQNKQSGNKNHVSLKHWKIKEQVQGIIPAPFHIFILNYNEHLILIIF